MQSFVGWSQISSRRSAQLLLFRHVAAVGGRMASAASAAITQPVYKAIEEKLVAAFHPTHLEIVNESHKHNVYVQR